MTFNPGDTMQIFSIDINDDMTVENPEQFVTSLSLDDPGAVSGPTSSVLIYDDGNNDSEIQT